MYVHDEWILDYLEERLHSCKIMAMETFVLAEDEDFYEDVLSSLEEKLHSRVLIPYDDCKKAVDTINERVAKGGKLFVDKRFPPTSLSVNRRPASEKLLVGQGPPPVQWRRPNDFAKSPALIRGGIDPGDVIQNAMRNCWLLGGIASLASKPALISDGMYPLKYIHGGCNMIRMRKDGKWWGVILDGYCTVLPSGRPYFMQTSVEGELWPLRFEKATAKLFGSYQDLFSPCSMCIDPLAVFGGGVVSSLNFLPHEQYFDVIHKVLKEDGGVAGAAGMPADDLKQGIGDNHAYSVLDSYRDDATGLRLIKLRNVWGMLEWTGDWSDKSGKWEEHPELKKKLNLEVKDDGAFWIDSENFRANFRRVDLWRPDGSTVTKDEIPNPEEYNFSKTYEDWTGNAGFEHVSEVKAQFSPFENPHANTLCAATCPMWEFYVDRDMKVRVSVDCASAALAFVCPPTQVGHRALFGDFGQQASEQQIVGRPSKNGEVELKRSSRPYYIASWAEFDKEVDFSMAIRGPQTFKLNPAPAAPYQVLKGEFTDDYLGMHEVEGPQYTVVAETDTQLLITFHVLASQEDWGSNSTALLVVKTDDDKGIEEFDEDEAFIFEEPSESQSVHASFVASAGQHYNFIPWVSDDFRGDFMVLVSGWGKLTLTQSRSY